MTYREPAERRPRLWHVTIVIRTSDSHQFSERWAWAKESHEAVLLVIHDLKCTQDDAWATRAVCGEDFAERESSGPPAESSVVK